MNRDEIPLLTIGNSLDDAIAYIEDASNNVIQHFDGLARYLKDAADTVISQVPQFIGNNLLEEDAVEADSYRKQSASFEGPHDRKRLVSPQKTRSPPDFKGSLLSEQFRDSSRHSEGFHTPGSEGENRSDLLSGGYRTPETGDDAAWERFGGDKLSFKTPWEPETPGYSGQLEESDPEDCIVPPLALPQSRVSVPFFGDSNSYKQSDSWRLPRTGSISDFLQEFPRRENVVTVKVDRDSTRSAVAKQPVRTKLPSEYIEADKAKLRKWFEKQSDVKVVKVPEADNIYNSLFPIIRKEAYQEHNNTRVFKQDFSLEGIVQDKSWSAAPAEADVPHINPVTYREAVEELSFSRHFGSARTEWAPPTIQSTILVSEVIRRYPPSEETELVEPIAFEIILREPPPVMEEEEVIDDTVDVVEEGEGEGEPQEADDQNVQDSSPPADESGETPQVDHIAELILVTTSFGGIKKHFFQSKLAQHMLDCKGVVYYLVDANRDFARARELKDGILFDRWNAEGVLKCEYINNRKAVILPQLIVDGISVGEAKAIQDLEDDGDLDYIIARMLCPSCLSEKGQELDHCPHCYVQYRTLIPPEYKEGVDIQRFCQGMAYDADGNDADQQQQ